MQGSGFWTIGRYALFDEIASGGMAVVHLGRQLGASGFARTVAIKRMHPHLAKDADLVASLLDEARIASRIRHANVVATLDVASTESDFIVVMEYVHGESLSVLLNEMHERGGTVPLPIVSAIVSQALHGLHAAHEARSESNTALEIVHRDVSPQNILVGVDGVARVADFGVAKAEGRAKSTRDGAIKGKIAYMPPEQILAMKVDRRADIYAAGVVLWEAIAAKRMIQGGSYGEILHKILHAEPPALRQLVPDLPSELYDVVDRAIQKAPDDRYGSAKEMARALEHAVPPALGTQVGDWVAALAHASLEVRSKAIAAIEEASATAVPRVPPSLARPSRTSRDETREEEKTEVTVRKPAPRLSLAPRALRRARIVALVAAGAAVTLLVVLGFRERSRQTSGAAPVWPASVSTDPIAIRLSTALADGTDARATPVHTGDASAAVAGPISKGSDRVPPRVVASMTAQPTLARPDAGTTPRPTGAPARVSCFYLEDGIEKVIPGCVPQ